MGFLASYTQAHVNALCVAAGKGEIGTVNTLLIEDANRRRRSCYPFASFFVALVNACDAQGWTSLHHAAKSGSWDVVRFLLGKGAAINAQTFASEFALEDSLTPLMVAAKYGCVSVVQNLLVWESIDFQRVNSHGMNALFFAVFGDLSSENIIMKLLIDKGVFLALNKRRETLLIFAAACGNLEAVRYITTDLLMDPMRSVGWGVNTRDIDGQTAYDKVAVYVGVDRDKSNVEVIKSILLSGGARVGIEMVVNPVHRTAVVPWGVSRPSGAFIGAHV